MDATLPIGHRLYPQSSTARIAGGYLVLRVVQINERDGPDEEFWYSIKTRKAGQSVM
jgi:hypothetical protein